MITGHCLCGNVTYSVDAESGPQGICHCDDCRRAGGATYSMLLTVPRPLFIVKGDYKIYKTVGLTGMDAHRYFCPNCGSQIATLADSAKDYAWIKVGTLAKEHLKDLQPQVEVFTSERLPFITDRYGPQFEQNLPSA